MDIVKMLMQSSEQARTLYLDVLSLTHTLASLDFDAGHSALKYDLDLAVESYCHKPADVLEGRLRSMKRSVAGGDFDF